MKEEKINSPNKVLTLTMLVDLKNKWAMYKENNRKIVKNHTKGWVKGSVIIKINIIIDI
jgi:hypothetical protein